MSDTIEKALIMIAELFLFITACMFTIGGINSQDRAIETVYKASVNEERRLFTSLEVNGQDTYTGAEVLQSIRNMDYLNADIRVGNRYFSKSEDINDLVVSDIELNRTYEVSYIRDRKGMLQTIVFT